MMFLSWTDVVELAHYKHSGVVDHQLSELSGCSACRMVQGTVMM
jgi:hypothetical protein